MQQDERRFEDYEFGFWPDVAGAVIVVAIIVFMFALADGSF